jgi:hypothetical protein
LIILDSRLRGNDEIVGFMWLCKGLDDYMGTRPAQRSYEPAISGCELYAFKTTSKMIGCKIYYKFTIKDETLWLVSLHKDRPEKKGK